MPTIKELREAHKMTQQELAERIGAGYSAVRAWERGAFEPRASALKAMAELFGVCMDQIDFPTTEEAKRKRSEQPT